MASMSQTFTAAMAAAVTGAAINAKEHAVLAPTLFLIGANGKIKIVEWAGDMKFHEADVDDIRRMIRPHGTVGIVFIVETELFAEDSQGIPQGMMDGALIYGYMREYRGTTPRAEARTFVMDNARNLIPKSMGIPPRLTEWVKRALSEA